MTATFFTVAESRYWPGAVVHLDAEDPTMLDRVADADGVIAYERDTVAEVQLDTLDRVPDLVTALATAGVRLTRVEPRIPTLDDLYFAVRAGRQAFAEGNTLGGPDATARFNRKRTAPSMNDVVGAEQ